MERQGGNIISLENSMVADHESVRNIHRETYNDPNQCL